LQQKIDNHYKRIFNCADYLIDCVHRSVNDLESGLPNVDEEVVDEAADAEPCDLARALLLAGFFFDDSWPFFSLEVPF
jgi:hypothetical protein